MKDDSIRQRKLDHIALALNDDAATATDPGWSDVTLVPVSLPTVNPTGVRLASNFLGSKLQAPIFIARHDRGPSGSGKDQ